MARVLVDSNLVDESTALSAAQSASRETISTVHYLVRNRLLDEESIALTAAREFQLPLLDLDAFDISACPQDIVEASLIRQHRALPLLQEKNRLLVAVSDPSAVNLSQELAFHSGIGIELVVTEDSKLETAIHLFLQRMARNYREVVAEEDSLEECIDISSNSDAGREREENTEHFDETPLVRFINKLLFEAIALHASDIHFEPYESVYRIRFRIDGLLQEMTCPPIKLTARLASRIKIMARLNIAEKRVPQDGRIRLRVEAKRIVDIRVNCLPTLWGEKIVMRLLDPVNNRLDIEALGMEHSQRKMYLEALQKNQGLILVTGPTGSGKSLTLFSGLNQLNTPSKNISTVEDPIEITIDGINQLAVNTRAGVSFASALRAMLRQDPDVIMLGEIRDFETAEIALRAAQTGHLVLSTLHTLSAAASLERLRAMGLPLFNLSGSIRLIIAQRLARKLCNNCKESIELPEKVLIDQGFTEESLNSARFYRAQGCHECREGFQGRIGFYEVVPISESLSRIIMEDGSARSFTAYMRSQNLPNLREAALQKVAQGLTSLDEANRLT